MVAMVCSMIGRPEILINCFGMSIPTRVPVPPARTTATVRSPFSARAAHLHERVDCAKSYQSDRYCP